MKLSQAINKVLRERLRKIKILNEVDQWVDALYILPEDLNALGLAISDAVSTRQETGFKGQFRRDKKGQTNA